MEASCKTNYFLTTERLGFSEWKDEFYPFALELWGDPAVSKLVTANGVFSEEEIKVRLETEITNKKLYNVQYYPIFLLDGDTFIGCCGLRPYNLEESVFEFGFYLKPAYWGKGYAYEAAKGIINYTISTIDVSNIYAGHHPDNTSSRKALERLGFNYFRDEYYAPTRAYHPLYRLYTGEDNILDSQ